MADNYPKKKNQVMDQIPENMPEVTLNEFDEGEAAKFASNFVQDFRNNVGMTPSATQVENAFDAKKMERMAKGMSVEQQTAMARQFNHYALLEALRYQFEHLDKFEADLNDAFHLLAQSREE